MSDIRKELKLVARLDTSEIKQQLEELKKLGGLGTSGPAGTSAGSKVDMSGLTKAFESFGSTLKEITKELQKAVTDVKGRAGAPGVQPGLVDNSEGGKGSRKKGGSGQTTFDPDRGVYKKLQDKDSRYDTGSGKVFKSLEDLKQYKTKAQEQELAQAVQAQEKLAAKQTKLDDVATEKRVKQELETARRVAAEKEKEEIRISKKLAADKEKSERKLLKEKDKEERRLTKQREKEEIQAVKTAGKEEAKAKREEEKKPGPMDRGGSVRNALGMAGAVGGAITGGVALQTQYFQRRNQQALDVMHGNALEGSIRAKGRDELIPAAGGALAGLAGGAATGAMLGSVAGPAGTVVGGVLGGTGGAIGGYFKGSEMYGENRVEQVRPGLEAFNKAKELIPSRMNAMRGGGVGLDQLTELQGMGALQGFAPSETLNQFGQARNQLGNRGAREALPDLQNLYQRTGLNTGEGADFISTLMGSGKIEGNLAESAAKKGTSQLTDTMKKAVSAGFDSSRVRELIATSNSYLQEQTGLAKLSTAAITDRITGLAKGFSGDGEVTSMSIGQAKQAEEISRQQSMSTTGASGTANYAMILDSIKKSGTSVSGSTVMNLAGLSSNAGPDAIKSILGMDKSYKGNDETTKKLTDMIMSGKQNTLENFQKYTGADASTSLAIMSKELGKSTEDTMGLMDARSRAKLAGTSTSASLSDGAKAGGEEFKATQLDANQAQQTFVSGIKAINSANVELAKGITEMVGQINRSVQSIKDLGEAAKGSTNLINRRPTN